MDLRGHAVHGVPLSAWLEALNRRVCEHVGRDARHLQIGHSYLLHDGRPIATLDALRHAVRDDIVPLLEEYCDEEFTALQAILGNGLLDRATKRWRLHDGQDAHARLNPPGPMPYKTGMTPCTARGHG